MCRILSYVSMVMECDLVRMLCIKVKGSDFHYPVGKILENEGDSMIMEENCHLLKEKRNTDGQTVSIRNTH